MPRKFFFKRVQTVEIATVDVQQLHFVRLRSLGAPAQYLQVVPKHEEKGSFFFYAFWAGNYAFWAGNYAVSKPCFFDDFL